MRQSLKSYNTFAVESTTANLTVINQQSDILNLIQKDGFDPDNHLLLGAGSNLLLLDSAPDLVIAMRMGGISYSVGKAGQVIVTAGAGVPWHHLVEDTLARGAYGLENLALIPGLVGAAPIQNIGAYGVELGDRFISLTAINLLTGEERIFTGEECQFGYRDSFFKHGDGQYYLITSVVLALTTDASISLDYKALRNAFSGQSKVDAKMVFEKVCEIRKSKLPDPDRLGNAGSFFKNPVIRSKKYQQLKQQFPDLVAYPEDDDCWKVAAGWMIEKAGLKGYRTGSVGVHVNQALVLVNYGGGTGSEIVSLAGFVQQKVEEIFSISLQPEVTIIGASGVVNLQDML